MNIGDLFWSFRGDGARLQADAKVQGAEAGTTLGSSVAASFKKSFTGANLGQGLMQGLGLAGGLGVARLVSDVTSVLGDSIKNASDLNETIQKSGVVFGESATEIKRWGEGAAASIGLSENAAIAAAASIGNLLLSTGTAPQKIAPMSEAVVKLAADLASFNNIPIEDALAKIQSGLVGQERPLRELGVAISAASVDAEALALGYTKVNGVFTEGEKVQARYALIFKQTGTAQGDFARTSDQFANQQRILQAELENTSAALGKQLLPVALDVERAFVSLAPALTTIVENAGALVPVVETLAAVFGIKLARSIVAAAIELAVASVNVKTFAVDSDMAAVSATGLGDATVAAGLKAKLASGIAVVSILAVLEVYNNVKSQIDKDMAALATQTDTFVKAATIDQLKQSRAGLEEALKASQSGFHPIEDALGLSATPAIEASLAKVTAAIAAMEDQVRATEDLKTDSVFSVLESQARGASATFLAAGGDLARARAMMLASGNDAALQKQFHRDGLLAEDAFAQGIRDRRQAPIDAFAKLVEDLKHPLSAAKETARLIGELTSQSMADGLASRDQVIHDQALYTKGLIIQELEKIAPQGGKLSKAAAAAVAKGLKSNDPDIRAASQAIYDRVHGIIEPLASDAYTWGQDTAKAFGRGLSSDTAVKAVQHGAYVSAAAAAAIIDSAGAAWQPGKPKPVPKPHRAMGGPAPVGSAYWVGELGPELRIDTTPGYIVPHAQSVAMAASGMGNTTYVTVSLPTKNPPDPMQTARDLQRIADFHR